MPYCAFSTGLTKRQPIVVSKISARRENASSAFGITIGARLMLSTPPARITSASPARMARAAVPMASRPEPQSRLIVAAGTVSGRPESSTAMRATLRLSSPAWLAQPMYASSIASPGRPGTCAITARITCASMSSGRTALSAPA